MTVTKKALQAALKDRLANDVRWATKALVTIYGFQTSDEQAVGVTRESNGAGFTAFDAEILTSLAQRLERKQALTPGQVEKVLLKKMPKYAGQIVRIAPNQHKLAVALGLIEE